MGDGAAGRADLFDLAAGFHEGVAAAGLGQAVGVDVAGILEIVGEGADAHFRRFLAAADRPSQARDVVAVARGAGEDRGRHDGREPGGVELLGFDRGERLLGLEVAVDGKHAAVPEHGDARQIERADMIERADHQQPRVGVQSQHQRLVGRLPVDVLVGQHHALGPVRGARRVHQPHQVARLPDVHRSGGDIGRKPRGAGLRGFVEQHHRRAACGDARELFIRNQDARAGIADDVADFVGGEPIVDRQKHRADMAGRKYEFEKGRAVLHQHRDDIAGADRRARRAIRRPGGCGHRTRRRRYPRRGISAHSGPASAGHETR